MEKIRPSLRHRDIREWALECKNYIWELYKS